MTPRSRIGWRRKRDSYMRRHPICERLGCCEASAEVHHILRDGDDHDSNLAALCVPHHHEEQAAIARGEDTTLATLP